MTRDQRCDVPLRRMPTEDIRAEIRGLRRDIDKLRLRQSNFLTELLRRDAAMELRQAEAAKRKALARKRAQP